MIKKITKIIMSVTLAIALVVANFANVANSLSITKVTVQQGPTGGGTTVTIEGEFEGAKQVSVGQAHACTLDFTGKAYCWSTNHRGELGNDTFDDSLVPVAVDMTGVLSGKTLTQVSAGSVATCAIDTVGKVYCWGSTGVLGIGTNTGPDNCLYGWECSMTPIAVNTAAGTGDMDGKTIKQVSVGANHACALDIAGKVYCWGIGNGLMLGNGTTGWVEVTSPVAVDTSDILDGKTLIQISVGFNHVCAIDTEGAAYCWGENYGGYLGDGTTTDSPVPVAVDTSGVLAGKAITNIAASDMHTCAVDSDGAAYCWGNSYYGQLGNGSINVPINESSPVEVDMSGVLSGKKLIQVDIGYHYTCALDSNGAAYCWGVGHYGWLGDGQSESSGVPVAVDATGVMSGRKLLQVETKGDFSCALDSMGQVYCWGGKNIEGFVVQGRLGNNTTDFSLVPVCVHVVLDGTGSELPGIGCGNELIITMDIDGDPAECINIVIAPDGKSLTCTTSSHIPGVVDVTISDGTNTVTLTDGYEYVDADVKLGTPNTSFLTAQTAALSILGLVMVVIVGVLARRHASAGKL